MKTYLNYLLSAGLVFSAFAPAVQAITFEPPGDPAPESTGGGASRIPEHCLPSAETVKPLLPQTQLGFTLAEHPTMYVYLPKIQTKQVFFSVQTETGEHHYQEVIAVPETGGIVGLQLPKTAPPLQENINYQWRITVICGEMLQPDSPDYGGWIRRIPHSNGQTISTELSLDQVAQLAKEKVWYDAVSSLVQLQQKQPNNTTLIENWRELLSSVGLEAIATQPLLSQSSH